MFPLPGATGSIKVQFDARTVFEKPDVKYPHEIRFAVRQLIGTMGASITAAETQPVVYR